MSYRKFKADKLFDGTEFKNEDDVLIMNEDGKFENIITINEAGEGVQFLKGIISPGFINAHCHLELSHLKGVIPKKTGLVNFVCKIVSDKDHDQKDILMQIENAEIQMLDAGIVAVGDICNNTVTIPSKVKSKMQYYNFVEVSGWAPELASTRFERSKIFYEEFKLIFPNTSLVPHAPYSVSEELWKKLEPSFENKVISIHNQEISDENKLFLNGEGDLIRMYQLMSIDNSSFIPSKLSSLKTYFKKLSSAKNIILVHNTYINTDDIMYINENTPDNHLVSYCICIHANLYIENATPPIDLLRKNNCNIIIGTDSLASNDQLSILEEMKTICKYFPQLPMNEILKWATSNGANALNMDTLGSFEKGKEPGVILIDKIENEMITSSSTSKRLL